MRRNFLFLLLLIMPISIIFAQINTSSTDVQSLKRCYKSVCDSRSIEAKEKYFDIFPSTFSEFKDVFGYEETNSDIIFGELYEESLGYITEFFSLNEVINLYDFSNKIIGLCINGEWQADGVNYLKANVINIVTSNANHDCYEYHFNLFKCYNDALRDTLLSCLAQYSEDEILSFWHFYLDGVANVPIDEELYNRTEYMVQGYPVLHEQLKQAYSISKRG